MAIFQELRTHNEVDIFELRPLSVHSKPFFSHRLAPEPRMVVWVKALLLALIETWNTV